jgi:hypothetical protein
MMCSRTNDSGQQWQKYVIKNKKYRNWLCIPLVVSNLSIIFLMDKQSNKCYEYKYRGNRKLVINIYFIIRKFYEIRNET